MKNSSSIQQKVLIIGGGIGGLSTGIVLAKLGLDVTAPGVIGTIIGFFSTVKLILGSDEFFKMISL